MYINFFFSLDFRHSKKSVVFSTIRGEKSSFYIATATISVCKYNTLSGKKWGYFTVGGLSPISSVTDIVTFSSVCG
jgi:hypothetical protein